MKNAAISVLSEICGLRTLESPRGQPVPCRQTYQRRRHNTSHLRESVMTAQNGELLIRTKIVLEVPNLTVTSKFLREIPQKLQCHIVGKGLGPGSTSINFKSWLYHFKPR